MINKQLTYVPAEKFEALIVASGLEWQVQAGWVKVKGAKGRNVYVARTKRVGRCELSGFVLELDGLRLFDEDERHGACAMGIDFTRDEDTILATFEQVLAELATLPERDIAGTRKPVGKKDDGVKGWTVIVKQ